MVGGENLVLERVDSAKVTENLFGEFFLFRCRVMAMPFFVTESPEVVAVEN